MKKTKWVSLLLSGSLALSLLSPISIGHANAETKSYENWNTERYGDRVDIDGQLNKQTESEVFQQQAEKKIKEQADEAKNLAESDEEADPNFSYDGGTKVFLNRNLAFKEFTLRSVGDNVEIWVAHDLSYGPNNPKKPDVVTQAQVDKLRDEFDQNIYPKATDFFGTPNALDGSQSPLPDLVGLPKDYYTGSDKVIMLVDNIQDEGWNNPNYPFFVAGFFWQTLENYINRNIITIDTNSWDTRLESTFFGTTIHELQHLIQADNDPSEETWLNEGMSTFSEYLGGYGHEDGSINFFLDHPENSLVNWDEHSNAETGPETIADYGEVYLFTLYLYDKFGHDFIKSLATDGTSQGIESVEKVLKQYKTKKNFTDVYQNFMTAITLDDRSVSKDYDIDSINLRDLVVDQQGTKRGKTVDFEKAQVYEKQGVPAWGGDFKSLDFSKEIRGMKFNGADFLPLQWKSVSDPLGSGKQVLWGNTGSQADNQMIFEADLSTVNNATLKFDHYYQIEEQWDFGAVQVSTDNGETWTSLANSNTREDITEEGYPNTKGNLPGFTGTNGGWTAESFDLSNYAGKKVLIAFRYMTDWGSEEAGWYINNISIPEIGLSKSGSSTEGFQSIGQVKKEYLEYVVTFIQTKKNGKERVYHVNPFTVTDAQALDIQKILKEGNVKMITSYAAKPGLLNPVDFAYEVILKGDKPNKGKQKGKNK
ncbi:choice-of-anchor J domain-containing protein [Rummeliibacillus sp. TYF005]|uniref:choice-of-anchor J domain-containing protein n=1 Tax=Rummeliibacillus sp. TYF005 TaxID=2058214 RepID=UPI000F51C056|nr:choice-of-anchor J domain-containing protein [Rummeliibacillus sp. TYF005]RPJ96001.1 peptidase M6 [Rummeliibacillus sp. TYF005]